MNFWKAQVMKFFFTVIVFISTPLVHAQEAELLEEEQSTAADPQEGGAEEVDEVEGEVAGNGFGLALGTGGGLGGGRCHA